MTADPDTAAAGELTMDAVAASELILDLWRIQRRAERDGVSSERVRVACEIAMDRARGLGFELRELLGEPYHPSMRVRVVHQEDDREPLRITDCLAPAVYYQGQLVRPAQVVVTGRGEDATADD